MANRGQGCRSGPIHLAVLADIHGNLPALEAVLADIGGNIDGTIVAGDFTCGSQSQEVVDRLRGLHGWLIRGNSEGYLLALDRRKVPQGWWEGEHWAYTRWSYQHLDRDALRFIDSLPEQRVVALDGADPIRVVHGSPSCLTEHLIPDRDAASVALFRQTGTLPAKEEPEPLERAVGEIEERVLICGHSHLAWQQEANGRLVLNPGSVGAPINGDPRAQYALLTWEDGRWQASLRSVIYDVGQVRAAFESTGLLAAGGAFARACLVGIETGQNVPGDLILHVRRAAGVGSDGGGQVLPDEVWARAAESFAWEDYRPGQGYRSL